MNIKIKLIFLIVFLGLFWTFFLKKEPLPIVYKQIIVEQNRTIEKIIDTNNIIKKDFFEKNISFIKEKNLLEINTSKSKVQIEEIDEILENEQEVVESLLEKEEKIRIQMIKEQEDLLKLYDLN